MVRHAELEGILDPKSIFSTDEQNAKYEAIADVLEQAIMSGSLQPGDRLPTVRWVAKWLGVSGTTTAAAYNKLADRGFIRARVGQGSFVTSPSSHKQASIHGLSFGLSDGSNKRGRIPLAPWRKRALTSSATQLRAIYPDASECNTGRPDSALLPIDVLKRSWQLAIASLEPTTLEHASPEPVTLLAKRLIPRLNSDNIEARELDLVIGSSAQQLMVLAMEVVGILTNNNGTLVAVEEPGFPTIFDAFERAGHQLVGVEVDSYGAVPSSLDSALRLGAKVVLFTPRAHNPTGASWSTDRMNALADVLVDHPNVFVIEDDQFADVSVARPGSLISDPRIEDRVFYIRSFSKSIAPDLRIAAAVVRPRLRSLLLQAKVFADGWSSRLAQHALANVFADGDIDRLLKEACKAYAGRRNAAVRALEDGLAGSGGTVSSGHDGVNVWIHLPPGTESFEVVERAATLGVMTASGEPFFISPGRNDMVRLNAGYVKADDAADAGKALATAATSVDASPPRPIII